MTQDYTDRIDDFLKGRMQGEALTNFMLEMESNEMLARDVSESREMIKYLEVIEDISLMQQVKDARPKENVGSPGTPTSRIKRIALVTVAAMLVLSFLFWINSSSNTASPEELYISHHAPYGLTFGSRGSNAEMDAILVNAESLYNEGRYNEALEQFHKVLDSDIKNTKVILAAALCQLELGDYAKAIDGFELLIEANDPLYGDASTWYAALAYVAQNNVTEAKKLLESLINNPRSKFGQQSKALLEEL